ncbi:MAG: hypothetical protein HRT88_10580 [Lentisphaeraceae bacterium]|nr:hypothetical protein [Lentisphaeraceae bacterium]
MIDKYVSTYERGWGKIRQERFERMQANGILPKQFKLSEKGIVPKVPNRNKDS